MKVVTIVGTRPELIKLSRSIPLLDQKKDLKELSLDASYEIGLESAHGISRYFNQILRKLTRSFFSKFYSYYTVKFL